MSQIARDMDAYSYRVPLGVCAGVAPFNFPAMIPLWVRYSYSYLFNVVLNILL